MRALALALVLVVPMGVRAQGSLPELRAALDHLNAQAAELQSLLTESFSDTARFSGGPLDRLAAMEQELRRLTNMSEQMQFRIEQILRARTERIADLDYRLCVLEPGCDPATRRGAGLAGNSNAQADPLPFSVAIGDLEAGRDEAAAQGFAEYLAKHPDGPLAAQAQLYRGQAKERLGDLPAAARAYLAAFSLAPAGDVAPLALASLGRAMGAMGQVNEACATLDEVRQRFGQSAVLGDVASYRAQLGCP